MRTRRKYLMKQLWFSICSNHGGKHNENCHLCNAGRWTYAWKYNISSMIFKRWPRLWRSFVNKKPSMLWDKTNYKGN